MAKKQDGTNRIVGISENWIRDTFIGIILGVLLYVFGNIFGFVGVIAMPSISQAVAEVIGTVGALIIIVALAPIFETIIFQEFALELVDNKVVDAPYLIASIFSSTLFMLYHVFVYASLNANGGSYVSAFLVGMAFCYVRRYFNSLMPVIMMHATLNFIIEFIVNRHWIIGG